MALRSWLPRFFVLALLIAFGSAPAFAQCGPMDVVFVVDNTASMTDVIAQVQQQVNAIADKVAQSSNGDYQLGLVVAPANDVNVLLDFSPKNRDAFGTAVNNMGVVSSCGEPAAWDDGIETVLHGLAAGRATGGGNGKQIGTFSTAKFRSNSTKIIIVISDARPNHTVGCDYTSGQDDAFVMSLANEAGARGIHMATVFVPTESAQIYGFGPTIVNLMQNMADASNGPFLTTEPDASDLGSVIQDVIANCGLAAGLIVAPQQVLLTNGESADVKVQNYRPGKDPSTLVYSSNGLPQDSTVTFTGVKPDVAGTDQRNMRITIGPDTLAGSYILNVNAGHTDSPRSQSSYVLVLVDCAPPIILGTPGNQPANTTASSSGTAQLKVVPVGSAGFKYQWYQGHSGSTLNPVAGATSQIFTTPKATAPTDYWVRVTNACGSVDSNTATVSP